MIASLLMPVAALLAVACVLLFDLSPHAVVTFGDVFSEPLGLLAWWIACLIPAGAYAVMCLRNAE